MKWNHKTTVRCQRCQRRVVWDRAHVNNFDELLCEVCEPNCYWDDSLGRSISWAELRLKQANSRNLGSV